jgi:flagellar basal body-associated protein FliL
MSRSPIRDALPTLIICLLVLIVMGIVFSWSYGGQTENQAEATAPTEAREPPKQTLIKPLATETVNGAVYRLVCTSSKRVLTVETSEGTSTVVVGTCSSR